MYLDEIAELIRVHIPADRMPAGDTNELFRGYAVLLRAKGKSVSQSDIHDAWVAWMVGRGKQHGALIPYEDLPEDVRDLDRVFAEAIRKASEVAGQVEAPDSSFSNILFPRGVPSGEEEKSRLFDLYKIMVKSSEGLVGRRQGVNTFFLTMNGALLTASGLIVQSASQIRLGAVGIAVLALAGILLCAAWRSLIKSFGQLNRGKFRVISEIERHFPAAIYAAEWEALGRGEDPKIYRSFTSREMWVPNALLALHVLTVIIALLIAAGRFSVSSIHATGEGARIIINK